ncbi:hypothetical protein [Nonomuraea sp. NPDC002799]
MSGTPAPPSHPGTPADQGGRGRRVLMASGVLLGTVMLTAAALLVGGAFGGRTLDALRLPGAAAPLNGITSAAVGSRTLTASPAPTSSAPVMPSVPVSSAPIRSALTAPAHSPTPTASRSPRAAAASRTPAAVPTESVTPQPGRSPAPAVTRTLATATQSAVEPSPAAPRASRRTRGPGGRVPGANP